MMNGCCWNAPGDEKQSRSPRFSTSLPTTSGLTRETRSTFIASLKPSCAFGAVRVIGNQIPFDQWRLSLAEAIGKSGGLSDTQADPGAVFLYRGETRKVAQKLGIDVSGFNGPIIPIIYTLNMRDPAVYFLATQFEMRNKDVIYVSNAVSVEVTKFLQYLQTINGTIQDPLGTAIGAYTLKGLIAGTGTSNVLVGVPSATTH